MLKHNKRSLYFNASSLSKFFTIQISDTTNLALISSFLNGHQPMNRNKNEIKEEIANKFVKRSMIAYPADPLILPLVLYLDLSQFPLIPIIEYHGQMNQCKICGSFFNPYCPIGESSINWKCSICGTLNQLPLPPSDSIMTAYGIAKKSISYNNAVFDVIPPHRPINQTLPRIVIAIQSTLFETVKSYILKALVENPLFIYSVIVFDSTIQIFNFHLHSWHAVADDFIMPTSKTDHFFETSLKCHHAFKSSLKPKNMGCNIEMVCDYVNFFYNSYVNTKLVLILCGSVVVPPPFVNFPVSVAFIGDSLSLEQFKMWENNPSITLQQFNFNNYIENEHFFYYIYKSLQYPFLSDVKITLRKPKSFSMTNISNHLYTITRQYNTNNILAGFIQFEIQFYNVHGIKCFRYITLRIPLSPDPKIYRSATFPNPLQQMFVAASFLVSQISQNYNETPLKLRNLIMELSYQFPLASSFWPHFIYKLITSDLVSDSINNHKRCQTLLSLKDLPPQLIFLYFLPLQYINKNLSPIFPKASKDATAQVNSKKISIIAEIGSDVVELLNIDEYVLPIEKVDSFLETADEEALFLKWKHNWEISSYGYNNEKREKLFNK
ncbi:hypothetical protein TRFO_04024 [Tritrichomonas foetus]|uniref:Zinc finger Sec23/Sec24-type domain-containing protein n=1 Tax=Tritrichomonas foetus TaxID=1144522 RepID=A0A1J4KI76_9EUKA|nr:hypothetical protein TRFO_04024 [Tritrichomonas foetus]|eukprot:OHT11087.1 hypothetical protein TRFO_04024 [Tritrichomonas foetus]